MHPTIEQLALMLVMQSDVNTKIDPNWLQSDNQYLRAAMVEMVEAIDHHGWAWWKKQTPDMKQVRMELVDVWHFILSHILVICHGDATKAANYIMEALGGEGVRVYGRGRLYNMSTLPLLDKMDLLVGRFSQRLVHFKLFRSVMESCDLSFTELFKQYIGKNVLNKLRQDNGYKTGTYIKQWDGCEDNVWLEELLSQYSGEEPNFASNVAFFLGQKYRAVSSQKEVSHVSV